MFLNLTDGRKAGRIKVDGYKPYTIKWFNFMLTSLVAVGCALDIVIRWISKEPKQKAAAEIPSRQ